MIATAFIPSDTRHQDHSQTQSGRPERADATGPGSERPAPADRADEHAPAAVCTAHWAY